MAGTGGEVKMSEEKHFLDTLTSIDDILKEVRDAAKGVLQKISVERPKVSMHYEDYISQEVTVNSTTKYRCPAKITEILGRKATSGYFYAKNGAVSIQFNSIGADKANLDSGDTFNLDDVPKLEVNDFLITTTSVADVTVRLFLV